MGLDLLTPRPRRGGARVEPGVNGSPFGRSGLSARRQFVVAKRVALWVLVGVGVLLAARGLVMSWQGPRVVTRDTGAAGGVFPGGEEGAFAARFAQAFLSWSPRQDRDARATALTGMLDPRLDAGEAVDVPAGGKAQRVVAVWPAGGSCADESVGCRSGRGVVRVAAVVRVQGAGVQTRYLLVPVARGSSGGLVVEAFPSVTSPPAVARGLGEPVERPLAGRDGAAVEGLVKRFMPLYLAGGAVDPEFLLRPGSVVPLGHAWRLLEVQSATLDGAPTASRAQVVVLVQARDSATKAVLTLRYRLRVARERASGKWLVDAVEVG